MMEKIIKYLRDRYLQPILTMVLDVLLLQPLQPGSKGYSVFNACKTAKAFVAAGIEHGVSINPYVGHIWHGAYNEAEKRMVAADENND